MVVEEVAVVVVVVVVVGVEPSKRIQMKSTT